LLNFTSFCCISWIVGHQIFTAKIITHVLENEHTRSHPAHMHTFIHSLCFRYNGIMEIRCCIHRLTQVLFFSTNIASWKFSRMAIYFLYIYS
jgi:hypothetical protein